MASSAEIYRTRKGSGESTKDRVPIRNLYFMLCYAWDCKHLLDDCPTDKDGEFDNVTELLEFLLVREVGLLVKGGFKCEYVEKTGALDAPRGRINIQPSFGLIVQRKMQLHCTYSVYSEDTPLNQIIAYSLRNCKSKRAETRRRLLRVLPYFDAVSSCEPTKQLISSLKFDRSNVRYRFIVNICRFLYEHILPSEQAGENRFSAVERGKYLAAIFEGFIREYYREFLGTVSNDCYMVASGNKQVFWATQGKNPSYLPSMFSDVWVEKSRNKDNARLFILDAKFYRKTLNDRGTFHSSNLYQLQSYMLNAVLNTRNPFGTVSGCLVYPETDRNVWSDIPHQLGTISIRTVDLNKPWPDILQQMQDIWWSIDLGHEGNE